MILRPQVAKDPSVHEQQRVEIRFVLSSGTINEVHFNAQSIEFFYLFDWI
jgi:hypothetical protein